MASLGCYLNQETVNGKEQAKTHNLYSMLLRMPNHETTAYEFWHMYFFNLMLSRGAYAKIVRDQNGKILEIWNIPTKNCIPYRNMQTGERYIDVVYPTMSHTGIAGERIYEANFMYTPGLRFQDEESSEDFIRIASEVLGLTMDLNSYAKDYFENGSNMGGFVQYPNGINEIAFNKFKSDWGKTYAGVTNQHKWAILEGGFEVQKMDSNPEQAQALESRKFQVVEVCRIMGIPPHKVFESSGYNYASMEQSNIEYVNETISPMDTRVCQTIYKDLLSISDRKKQYYAKFNINTLLRGDTATRTAYYNSLRQNGVLSSNDIRYLEDMNAITEEGGNEYFVNGNMITLASAKLNLPKSAQGKGGSNN
jgi:HK97 family phage portal protein